MTTEPPPSNLMLDLDALTAATGEQPDRQAAWRFIRAFARDWGRSPLTGADGHAPAGLDAAQARLGLPLPVALRDAYQLLGRRSDLTDNQDSLLAPESLYVDADRGVLVFRVENQSCAYWGIRVTDLDQDDPPVVVRADLVRPTADDWAAWLGRVSVAFVEIVLSEALCADEDLMGWVTPDGPDLPEDIAATFRRLPLPEYPISQQPGSRWYAHDEIILRDDRGTAMFRARTEAAFDRFDGEDEDDEEG
ncbi:SMI1/KNR4 family protein [Streptomyces sp. NBC_00893]|uniref:SMI1/KNR4 family protein n=1 Tax=Streptomyces sp. NBC_00893 TaxID=2975862 RepID=UPI0022566E3E|nr:SMI1/KNR4 family protein [Streptomyces sp. NBC_00893]MCX4847601.1 SMI1/KNR4 family protein [Streptomyces sp. NBC_00893]